MISSVPLLAIVRVTPPLNTGAPKQSTSPQPQGQEGKTSKVKTYPKEKDTFQNNIISLKGEIVENGMFYFARRQLLEKGLFQVRIFLKKN